MNNSQITSLKEFQTTGYFLQENFISQTECDSLLQLIADYRQTNSVPKIYRNVKPIPLSYFVIDGKRIQSQIPEVQKLYETVNQVINNFTNKQLFPLQDIQVGCNINITEKGGTYRWHYDRNAITALLYLNKVDGGEIQLYPNYRITLPEAKFSRFQSVIDRVQQLSFFRQIFGKQIMIKPQPGLLLVMAGDKCLHSVRPVTEEKERINIVMAYDLPNANFVVKNQLNTYLYSSEKFDSKDPNYS
ncbi:2OG-Fe(II) oxygenase [Okeania sp.]|uniref:2OG-Fe(II) oxygenase n=1 Tax=Okeania sp. TaxID=3100323 RepID=UPI002B4AB3C5|nr:2OG-Fe(II) oxygenase [Okeania sp.]MEB3339680.1 2OG-Fe(II) oxygenase [Okeania sp.]